MLCCENRAQEIDFHLFIYWAALLLPLSLPLPLLGTVLLLTSSTRGPWPVAHGPAYAQASELIIITVVITVIIINHLSHMIFVKILSKY